MWTRTVHVSWKQSRFGPVGRREGVETDAGIYIPKENVEGFFNVKFVPGGVVALLKSAQRTLNIVLQTTDVGGD